jgi:hypothetical protein
MHNTANSLNATSRPALSIVHCGNRRPHEMIGVYGLNVQRMAHETSDALVARLEAYVLATRPLALPFVGLAQYAEDLE